MKVSASIDFSRFVYTWHNARQCCQIGESRPKSTEKRYAGYPKTYKSRKTVIITFIMQNDVCEHLMTTKIYIRFLKSS